MRNVQILVMDYRNCEDKLDKNILLSEIIEECENTLRYFTLKYKNIPMDSEDLRAEMLTEIYICCDKYNEGLGCEFKTYLSSCLERKCCKIYRDSTRQKRMVKNQDGEILYSVSYDEMLENGASVGEAEGTTGDYTDVEIKMLLDKLNLPKDERLICEGFARGLQPKEMASILGLSPAMITYKTKKIRTKMQISLNF